ncbi:MAG TPA: CoA pyrophosphatase [Prolixibacteraceae bacterium]|nr:CoA pyrophosphatase [Prolixibacteraceae bacterium]
MRNPEIDEIQRALNGELPGREAHLLMVPPGRPLLLPEERKEDVLRSAVLAALILREGSLHFCLTRRSAKLKHHPGQISFPGGRIDTADDGATGAALRELREETGIEAHKVDLLGRLSEVYVPVSNFCITPLVGYINDPDVPFSINTREVDELIFLPVSAFLEKRNQIYQPVETTTGRIIVPGYRVKNCWIWGATAMMIAEFSWLLKQHADPGEGYSNNARTDR